MKKTINLVITVLLISLFYASCGKKTKEKTIGSVSGNKNIESVFEVNIPKTLLDDNWNKLGDNSILSKEEYDNLKLGTLSFIDAYGELQYEVGDILIDQDNKKLLTVKCVSSGEISEYLLGYINDNITDSLMVAYEDNVEYYSKTSSVIEQNKVTVTTVNWDYVGLDEVTDTIISQYTITPDLTFEEIINE